MNKATTNFHEAMSSGNVAIEGMVRTFHRGHVLNPDPYWKPALGDCIDFEDCKMYMST